MRKLLETYRKRAEDNDAKPIAVIFFFLWFASVQTPILTYFGYLLYGVFFEQLAPWANFGLFFLTLLLGIPYFFAFAGNGEFAIISWVPFGLLGCFLGLQALTNISMRTYHMSLSTWEFNSVLLFGFFFSSNFRHLYFISALRKNTPSDTAQQ